MWDKTRLALVDAKKDVAKKINEDCKAFIAKEFGVSWNDLEERLGNATLHSYTEGAPQIYSAFSLNPQVYALVPEGETKKIYWRPGETGAGRQTLNWILGAVLHETLHLLGVGDIRLQDKLGFNPALGHERADTDFNSRELAKKCF